MHNFPYSELPMFWRNYWGQEHAVALASKWIQSGAKSLPRSIFISGKTGTGKTSFVKLLMRSFRCLDRAADSTEPCGQCAACLDLDERIADRTQTDVYWVQPGGYNDDETLGKQVKTALAAAARGQRRTDRPNQDVLWVVFDEWQNFPINLRQEILIRSELEVPGNNVCYIFITMQEERLTEEDRIALMSRGIPLKFRAFKSQEIQEFLKRYDLEPEVSNLIAGAANGSLRMAQAYLDSSRSLDPTLGIAAVSKITGMAPDDWRWELWSMLAERVSFLTIKNTLESILEYCDRETLIRQLQTDLLFSIDSFGVPTQDHTFALFCLAQMQTNSSVDMLGQLGQLIGIKIVCREGVFRNSSVPYSVTED
jgi:hypothetical protein